MRVENGPTKEETIKRLWIALQKKSRFHRYMHQLLQKLGAREVEENPFELGDVFDVPNLRWDPVESAMPDPGTGVVCCLLSLRNFRSSYIGQTEDIARRQRQHNSGFGSQESANLSLRPWHTHGYVCGFRGRSALERKRDRERFEKDWRQVHHHLYGTTCGPMETIEVGKSLVRQYNDAVGRDCLRFVETGKFSLGPSYGSGTLRNV